MDVHTSTESEQELSDCEKLKIEHRFEILRLLLDRLLIGALIGLSGFCASLSIEHFKATATDTHYFLEKRFEAATQIRKVFSEVTGELFKQTNAVCDMKPDQRPSVKNLNFQITEEINLLNSSALLFREGFLDDAEIVLAIFLGAAAAPEKITCEAGYFFSEVADYFTYRTKQEALNDSTLKWSGFVPLRASKANIDSMGSIVFFQKNLDAWRSAHSKPHK